MRKELFFSEGIEQDPFRAPLQTRQRWVPSPLWRLTPRPSAKSSSGLQGPGAALTELSSLGSQVWPFHPGLQRGRMVGSQPRLAELQEKPSVL